MLFSLSALFVTDSLTDSFSPEVKSESYSIVYEKLPFSSVIISALTVADKHKIKKIPKIIILFIPSPFLCNNAKI